MKNTGKFLAMIASVLAIAVVVVWAGEKPAVIGKPVPLTVHQTVCPVMGGKIDSTEYTDIQGQRVYHCCGGCAKKLKADPDKYFKKTAEQGVLFENIQKRCPVSGAVLAKKEIFTDYEGRRVYLSDSTCVAKFAADPAKYLKILDTQTKEDAREKPAVKDEHEGHH